MKRRSLFALIACLFAVNLYAGYALRAAHGTHALRVSVLDIGQGDAILVTGPTGVRMLVDGGPDRAVLGAIASETGLFDRSLDLVVETHPDKDHIGGLPAVFDRYQVRAFMEPGIPDGTNAAAALVAAAAREPGVKRIVARRGMRINLGGGAYADVLSPDRDPSRMETNDGSIVMHLV